ncbi:hypothetical protein ABVT39_017848, partial [Epinephelus coioides]
SFEHPRRNPHIGANWVNGGDRGMLSVSRSERKFEPFFETSQELFKRWIVSGMIKDKVVRRKKEKLTRESGNTEECLENNVTIKECYFQKYFKLRYSQCEWFHEYISRAPLPDALQKASSPTRAAALALNLPFKGLKQTQRYQCVSFLPRINQRAAVR